MCAQVRRERDCEGRVLYYVKEGTYSTIGLCKIKTVWYIIVRALREKASFWLFKQEREMDSCSPEAMVRSTHKRLAEIRDWLQLSQTSYNQWLDLGEKFLLWCCKQQQTQGSGFSASELRPQFPRWWRQFLASQGSSSRPADDIPPFDD
ncbi:hypothetical protein FHG87_023519 [Trinorchestia longiramus]|nr:hypothetical protein FHG87_023519 [Trinorchestia longiramus]